jgi:hypothetical protein
MSRIFIPPSHHHANNIIEMIFFCLLATCFIASIAIVNASPQHLFNLNDTNVNSSSDNNRQKRSSLTKRVMPVVGSSPLDIDNGVWNGVTGQIASYVHDNMYVPDVRVVDDVQLAHVTRLRSFRVFATNQQSLFFTVGNIVEVFVFANNGNQPPGALIASVAQAFKITPTGDSAFGNPAYQLELDFVPALVLPPADYWIGWRYTGATGFGNAIWLSSNGAANSPSHGYLSEDGGVTWRSANIQFAFGLVGKLCIVSEVENCNFFVILPRRVCMFSV